MKFVPSPYSPTVICTQKSPMLWLESDPDVATWQSAEDVAVERAVRENDVRTLAHEARACLTKYVSLSLV